MDPGLYELSEQQFRQRLAAGDPELLGVIESELENKVESAWPHASYEWEGMDPQMLVEDAKRRLAPEGSWVDAIKEVVSDEVAEQLDGLPDEYLEPAILEQVITAAKNATEWKHDQKSVFQFHSEARTGGTLVRPLYATLWIDLGDEDEPWRWMPAEQLGAMLGSASSSWWEGGGTPDAWTDAADDYQFSSPWLNSGYDIYLKPKSGAWGSETLEWAVDLRQDYFSDLVHLDPDKAIDIMMDALKADHPEIYKLLRKHKPPKSVLINYASYWIELGPDHTVPMLKEAMGMWEYEGTRGEEILTITKDELRELGITQGKWWDGAPWKLLDLPPEELAYEGMSMRHCVGRADMHYRGAVASGQIMIWSLRSRFNRPVLTMEVRVPRWRGAEGPHIRGAAIAQAKKKFDRLPPEDWQEGAVLRLMFRKLDVEPMSVVDWQGGSPRPAANPAGQRSFNLPQGETLADVRARLLVL